MAKQFEGMEEHKLNTPTGKLEFYSKALAKAYPHDKERGPIPKWIEKSHNHDERLRDGVAYMDHGARHDPIKTGEIERGGAINTITPGAVTSENCVGQIGGGYPVEVQKVSGEEMGAAGAPLRRPVSDRGAALWRRRGFCRFYQGRGTPQPRSRHQVTDLL